MTCEAFRNSIDRMADSKQTINRDDLSPEMRSHLKGCTTCTEYIEDIITVERILSGTSSNKIPRELYDKLINFGNERRVKVGLKSNKPLILYILKILLPGLSVWIISLFIPYTAQIVVEIVLMTFALVLVFEKIGRRLITDRI